MKGKSIKFAMMTIQQAQQQLLFQLYHIYHDREAANIADWVMEHITGWKKVDRIINKHVSLRPDKIELLNKYIDELLAHKPIQYVLHESWFYGMRLYVNENVLIPRPETEELVNWVIEQTALHHTTLKILDVGTGSGCIPIALKRKLPSAEIFACDISEQALEVAKKNAEHYQTAVNFFHLDFLNVSSRNMLPSVNIIVSNPPYILSNEKDGLPPNVIMHEPHQALFVDDGDSLLFYKALAEFAIDKLEDQGCIFAEINETMADEVKWVYLANGFSYAEVKKDMQGKDRMVKAIKSSKLLDT